MKKINIIKYILIIVLYFTMQLIHSIITLTKCDFFYNNILLIVFYFIIYVFIFSFLSKKEKITIGLIIMLISFLCLIENVKINKNNELIYKSYCIK